MTNKEFEVAKEKMKDMVEDINLSSDFKSSLDYMNEQNLLSVPNPNSPDYDEKEAKGYYSIASFALSQLLCNDLNSIAGKTVPRANTKQIEPWSLDSHHIQRKVPEVINFVIDQCNRHSIVFLEQTDQFLSEFMSPISGFNALKFYCVKSGRNYESVMAGEGEFKTEDAINFLKEYSIIGELMGEHREYLMGIADSEIASKLQLFDKLLKEKEGDGVDTYGHIMEKLKELGMNVDDEEADALKAVIKNYITTGA